MQDRSISVFNFEQCIKCAICTTVCPVMANNPLYGGPKHSGPDGERYRLKNSLFYEENLKLCLNCKRCEVACPSGVNISELIQSAKIASGHGPGLREIMLANTDFVGSMATKFAPVVNWGLSLAPVKGILDATVGVAKKAPMPSYAKGTFASWFNKNAKKDQSKFSRQITFYHGCYANYNYPQLGKDFVKVMNALGYGVNILDKERCCGVAKITNGLSDQAKRDALHNMSLFQDEIAKGREILTVSTSCTLTIIDEYPALLKIDKSSIRDHISLVERFIYNAVTSGNVKLAFKPDYKAKAAYHCPCHQEKLGWKVFTIELLRMIPGLDLTVLDSNCCGIAGTYGFKKENYEVSQKIGKPLFDQIKKVDPDFVACECETCKWQIEGSTGYKVMNPVSILAEALDLEKTAELNRN